MTPDPLFPSSRTRAPLESPAQLAVIAVVLWLLGSVIHPLGILAPLGVVLLLIAAVAYFARPRRHTMFWRGREIDLDDSRGPAEQLYRRLFRN